MTERSTGLARGRNHVCHAACCSHAGMPVLSRPATMVGPYRWRATGPKKSRLSQSLCLSLVEVVVTVLPLPQSPCSSADTVVDQR